MDANGGKARISMTIDPDLLGRIDEVCLRRRESRSAMIERVMAYALEEHEEHLKSLENPLTQALVRGLTRSPEVLGMLAKLVGESMSQEELSALRTRALSDVEEAAVRRERKKSVKAKKREGSGGSEGPGSQFSW